MSQPSNNEGSSAFGNAHPTDSTGIFSPSMLGQPATPFGGLCGGSIAPTRTETSTQSMTGQTVRTFGGSPFGGALVASMTGQTASPFGGSIFGEAQSPVNTGSSSSSMADHYMNTPSGLLFGGSITRPSPGISSPFTASPSANTSSSSIFGTLDPTGTNRGLSTFAFQPTASKTRTYKAALLLPVRMFRTTQDHFRLFLMMARPLSSSPTRINVSSAKFRLMQWPLLVQSGRSSPSLHFARTVAKMHLRRQLQRSQRVQGSQIAKWDQKSLSRPEWTLQ